MANIIRSVQWAVDTANDDTHGYSQVNRTGPDYDCSSFVTEALLQGGFVMSDGATQITSCGQVSTSNLANVLLSCGFYPITISQEPRAGDIFMWDGSGNQGHAFMCINSTQKVEAASDRGYPQTGDQTGTEVWITDIYPLSDHTWLRFRAPAGSFPSWQNKVYGGYERGSEEAYINAMMVYSILSERGWTLNAIAGLLGSIEAESGYNPWRYENNNIQSVASAQTWGYGYGLVQFTPCRKYQLDSRAQVLTGFGPNYSDRQGSVSDGTAQLLFIDSYADYYPTTSYPETYQQYKSSIQSADYLARAWVYNYERPLDPSASLGLREAVALYWYDKLSGVDPVPPGPIPGRLPAWLLKVIKDKNFTCYKI